MPNMIVPRPMQFLAAGLICFLTANLEVHAQRPAQYQPARPTISPYARLLQTNVGPIPNYYSLVRPQLQQRAFNQQLQATTRVQSLQIQALSTGTPPQPLTPQTGKSAGFGQHLHYFPPVQPVQRR
jgi:hypothetical protein